jgi:iron-regulated transporter 1
VRNAGIGLACLYMTVLGFDSITMGYAYSQGVPESILGILLATGAAVGLLGSVAFPFFVRCIGVERTGDKLFIHSMLFEVILLQNFIL